MHLTIDTGNTRTKYAVFDADTIVATGILENAGQYSAIFGQYPITAVISSSVGQDMDWQRITPQTVRYCTLNAQLPLPISILYQTLETLGPDRIAACVGAAHLFPSQPCLVIDAGTCITVDIIEKNIFNGIAIMPGLTMKFVALHTFTKKLPLLHLSDINTQSGTDIGSTSKSIIFGVFDATVMEISGFYRSLCAKHQGLKVVMTGGDGELLGQKLKSDNIDPTFVKDLTLVGLNKILEYNEKQSI